MEMKKIVSLAEKGQISKRVSWQLMREKFLILQECMELLQETPYCKEIHIKNNSIVYEADGGAKILFDFKEKPICRAEVMLCRSERENWDFIQSLIHASGTVLDIGANVGWFSIQLAKKYPEVKIYAFEPVASTYAQMKRNLEINNLGRVITLNAGLYDRDGESTIYVPATSEASSLKPIEDFFYMKKDEEGQTAQSCQIKTLDTFVLEQKIERIDFIKCDVEGAEKMVFAGGTNVFTKLRPIVYTEMLRKHAARFDYHPNEIIEMFKNLGYACYIEVDNHLLPFAAMDENTEETNFFFLHDEKHRFIVDKLTHK